MFWRKKNARQPVPLNMVQSWWLFAAAIAALAPLLQHVPVWLSTAAGVGMAWRAWLIWRAAHLPPRWIMLILIVGGCVAIALEYRSLFGRNPGLALLVMLLALKLFELRSAADGMVVILLSCFLLLASFFFGQGILSALLVVAALIIIIAALLALQNPQAPRRHIQHSATLLAQALPFMLVLFVLFPRVQGPLWGLPQDAYTASSGLSESMSPGSISKVAQSDAIAFRVQFKGAPPLPQQQYWRGLTMIRYDGVSWKYRPEPELRELPYEASGKAIDYEVTLEPHNQRWLFALDKPGLLPPETSISADGLLLADQPVRNRLRYSMRSYPDFKADPQTTSRIFRAALQLPDGVNPRTRALAEGWRDQYQDSEKIVQVAIAFFQNQLLTYTLNPPLMQENAVDAFLFEHKRGFCEHFASAFAFAMRAAMVPARVVGGYQGGEINPVDGYFTVRQYDAHVWVEVWLKDKGWVRVDPTADSAPSRIENGLSRAVPADESLPMMARGKYEWLRELRYRWDATANTWNQIVLGFNPEKQRDLMQKLGMPEPDWKQMTAWLAGLCGLLLLGFTLFALHQRRQVDEAGLIWQRFQRRLLRRKLQLPSWMGPSTLARHAAAQLPQHAAAIHAIAESYVALRYADQQTPAQLAHFKALVARFKP
jgi:transglutaminase-like putative cysteine protease